MAAMMLVAGLLGKGGGGERRGAGGEKAAAGLAFHGRVLLPAEYGGAARWQEAAMVEALAGGVGGHSQKAGFAGGARCYGRAPSETV